MRNPEMYDWRHQKRRKAMRIRIDAGGVNCCRCGGPIQPGAPFHLDHDDEDKTKYKGAAHPKCNISANQGGWRARKEQALSDDELYVGYPNAPVGTISNNGMMIKTECNSWRALWVHKLMTGEDGT